MQRGNGLEVENLLINKLKQKTNFTKREIKKFLINCDINRNGVISLNRLESEISKHLPGVNIESIQTLTNRYNVHEDGYINFDDLFELLESSEKQFTSRTQQLSSSSLSSSSSSTAQGTNFNSSNRMRSENETRNLARLHAQLKTYAHNLKLYFLREATKLRKTKQIKNTLNFHNNELLTNTSCILFLQYFEHLEKDNINFRDFLSVLNSIHLPGLPEMGLEVFQLLFQLSSNRNDQNLLDLMALVEIVFKDEETVQQQQQITNESGNSINYKRNPIKQGTNSSDSIPDKFICNKSRTTYMKPTYLTERHLEASGNPPSLVLARSFVFGLKLTDLYSGPKLHCLIPKKGSQHRIIVYATASLGVIHNLSTNSQKYFQCHTDDITCVNVDPTTRYAISGQIGKDPALFLWETNEGTPLKRLGADFFQKGICACCFSHDTKYICAIDCDDHHSLGIWEIESGQLVVQSKAIHGIPPQVSSLVWCSEYVVVPELNNIPVDLFVTAGERHIRFWYFQRPNNVHNGILTYKVGSMAQMRNSNSQKDRSKQATNEHPKTYLCAVFIPSITATQNTSVQTPRSTRNQSYNVVSAGNNGSLYLWENCICTRVTQVSQGPIHTMKVLGTTLYCGCSEGKVKAFDSNFRAITEFSIGERVSPSLTSQRKDSIDKRSKSTSRSTPRNKLGNTSSTMRPQSRDDMKLTPRNNSDQIQKNNSASQVNILGLEIDPISFFYASERGGITGQSLITATSDGNLYRIHINAPQTAPPTHIFSFHVGSLWALTTTQSPYNIAITGGDDRWLMAWSLDSCSIICRQRLQGAIRCVHVNSSNKFIAVGCTRGVVSLHYFDLSHDDTGTIQATISQSLVSRTDSREDLSDVKFNPSSDKLAIGSHDNMINIYNVITQLPSKTNNSASAQLIPFKRLRGHSSYITHLDWSVDGTLIQSTCGAYELLYWDVETGRQFASMSGWNPSDMKWASYTCILGFSVMGIWPQYADGTDINALDVSMNNRLVATADDSGKINLLNYPCIVKNAPRRVYGGHSSHVTNIRFTSNQNMLVTVGGNDKSVICWSVVN